jgi:hypothetical protein
LADEYGLELLDINSYTEDFLHYSSYSLQTIISDRLHFEDVGHKYEAGLLFSLINPQVTFVKDSCKIDYSNQCIAKGIPEDWLTMPASVKGIFKVYVNYTKADTEDMNIMTVYVFNNTKNQLKLSAYKSVETSCTYVKIDGETMELSSRGTGLSKDINADLYTDMGTLDLGLHKLEVFTGKSNIVDFKGFTLE